MIAHRLLYKILRYIEWCQRISGVKSVKIFDEVFWGQKNFSLFLLLFSLFLSLSLSYFTTKEEKKKQSRRKTDHFPFTHSIFFIFWDFFFPLFLQLHKMIARDGEKRKKKERRWRRKSVIFVASISSLERISSRRFLKFEILIFYSFLSILPSLSLSLFLYIYIWLTSHRQAKEKRIPYVCPCFYGRSRDRRKEAN